MVSFDYRNYRNYLIPALVGLCALFALWIRLIPMFNMGGADPLTMVAMDDPLYNLRQVEVMLAHFPGYAWFDPMTLYPAGSTIYWGPLFPGIIAVLCLLSGASTRPEIISMALLVPPLMAAATVVVMYYVGRTFGDYKTGLVASLFTAVIGGQLFSISFYGYIDHHIAEVLFSTIFCAVYTYAVVAEKDRVIDLMVPAGYRRTILLGIAAGIAYLLGLFVMPTMILFAMIVALYTVVQFVIDFCHKQDSTYLLVLNAVTFAVAIAGLIAFGLRSTILELSTYSAGHLIAYAGLIGGTCLLWYLAGYLRGKPWYQYPAALLGIAAALAAALFMVSRQLFTLFVFDLFAFFGQQAVTNTVIEAMGWSWEHAWDSFGYGLLLFFGGALVILYYSLRERHPHHMFALIWSGIMLLATWQHVRYEYYLAICIALLAAVCVSFAFDLAAGDLSRIAARSLPAGDAKDTAARKKAAKGKKQHHAPADPAGYARPAVLALVVIIALMFVYTAVSVNYTNVSSIRAQMSTDWRESAEWLSNNSPDPGVGYLSINSRDTFTFPAQAYGVMSWWDYGHVITYIGKRIPNANPFQQGVAGANGSAAYFVSTSEDRANAILDNDGTRYIITDSMMDDVINGKFHAMATWDNSTAGLDPYVQTFYVHSQDNASEFQPARFIRQDYFLTMVARLHTFDGSMTDPSVVYFLISADPSVTGAPLPVITNGGLVNASTAQQGLAEIARNPRAGYAAGVYSADITRPAGTVPALRHYRLIHESPTSILKSDTIDVKYVKVFEYVPGAHIKGDGIISVPVVTDTGRQFTYRQESIGGEFVVPYATSGSTYGVKTTGPYTIEGTGRTFEVPESAVTSGAFVN